MEYLFLGLAFFVIAKVSADGDDGMDSCLELFNSERFLYAYVQAEQASKHRPLSYICAYAHMQHEQISTTRLSTYAKAQVDERRYHAYIQQVPHELYFRDTCTNKIEIDNMCCESFETFEKIDESSKKCMKEDSEDLECEDFECFMRETGVLKDNKIDDDAIKTYLDGLAKEVPEEKSALDRVRSHCLGGQYEKYPPEDACPAIKFYLCIYVNVYLECSSWKTDENCVKMAENAKKCRAALDN